MFIYAEVVEDDDDDNEEEDEDVLDVRGGVTEDASLLGGEGVRARTSTTFRCIGACDAAAVKASRLPVLTTPERGDSERFATPTARDAATPVLGGDDDLERGTDSTTFKVEDIVDADGCANDLPLQQIGNSAETLHFAYSSTIWPSLVHY